MTRGIGQPQPLGEQLSPPMRLPGWALLLIVALLSPTLLIILSAWDDPPIPRAEHFAVSTHYQFSGAATPPLSGWKPTTEFDPADRNPADELVSIWQAFAIDIDAIGEGEQLGIFLAAMFANYRIYVGEDLVAQPAPMETPLYVNRVPRFYPIAREQLIAAGGVVHVNSVAENPNYEPFYVFIGPFQELNDIFLVHEWQRATVPRFALTIIVLLASAVFVLWLLTPSRTDYFWYAVTVALFAAHSGWFMYAETPITAEWWSLIGRLTLFLALAIVIFYHRYFGEVRPRTEWGFTALLMVAAGYMAYCVAFSFEDYLTAMHAWALRPPRLRSTPTVISCYACISTAALKPLCWPSRPLLTWWCLPVTRFSRWVWWAVRSTTCSLPPPSAPACLATC